MKKLIKGFLINGIIILLLSIIGAIVLTIFSKYVFEKKFFNESFFVYLGYYTILVFIIQIVTLFWLIYFAVNFLIKRSVNLFLVSLVSGSLCTAIIKILALGGFETYLFEPFKHNYQIFPFFFFGFFYPYVSKYIRKLFFK